MDKVKLSISQLHTLNGCEQSYWFQYVVGMERVKSEALSFGSAYDLLINRLHGDCSQNIFSIRGEDINYLRACIEEYSLSCYTGNGKPQQSETGYLTFMHNGEVYQIEVYCIADLLLDNLIVDNKTTKTTPKEISLENLEQLITYSWIFGIRNVRINYLVKLQKPKIVPFDYTVTDYDITRIKEKFIEGAKRKLELLNGSKAIYNDKHIYCWTSACSFWNECELINGIKIKVPKSGKRL